MSSGADRGSSRLFLMLATTTFVIANYQRPRDNSSLKNYEQIGGDRRTFINASRIQEQISVPHLRHHRVTHRGPYFENAEGQWINGSQNVGLHLGSTAMLDCRVAMLDRRTVMWMRKSSDGAFLLTLGKDVHISDPRYNVSFQYPNNWRLTIDSVRKEDRGQYVCEVNTHPPTMLITNVTVLAPDIRIVDEASHELRDRYYKTGSGIELTCIVRPARPDSRVPHPSWTKADETLPDRVNVYRVNGSNDELITGLRIERAKKADSGEYTCSLGRFTGTTVQIHVLNGEKQAAVHHDQWNAARRNDPRGVRVALLTLLTTIHLFIHATCSLSSSSGYSLLRRVGVAPSRETEERTRREKRGVSSVQNS